MTDHYSKIVRKDTPPIRKIYNIEEPKNYEIRRKLKFLFICVFVFVILLLGYLIIDNLLFIQAQEVIIKGF